MFKNFYKKILLSAIALIAIMATSTDVWSQSFIMDNGTATYNATCGAVIKMKSATSVFVNTGALSPFGTTAVAAIPGVVDWAATATQPVQGLYYNFLVLSGAAKTMAADVYVVGSKCTTPLNGYTNLSTYPYYYNGATVDYAGNTFHYAGDADQNIYAIDNFLNLDFSGTGKKVILKTDAVTLTGALTSTATTPSEINIAGGLTLGLLASTLNGKVVIDRGESGVAAVLNLGDGALTLNGVIDVTNGSIISGTTDGLLTIGATGALTLNTASSVLNIGDGRVLDIKGSATNIADGTNLLFECTSTVKYSSTVAGQIIMPTLYSALNADKHMYGNLELSGEAKVGGFVSAYAADKSNINICTSFKLADGDLTMNVTGPVTGYVYLDKVASDNVTYGATGTGTEEVIGGFRRKLNGAANDGTQYVYNNAKTSVAFPAADGIVPTTVGGYYQLDVKKGTSPSMYESTTDVKRKITVSYTYTGMSYALRAGYYTSELASAVTNEPILKFFEATSSAIEKVAGSGYDRTDIPGTGMHSLTMKGIIDGSDPVEGTIEKVIANNNDLVLRASNSMISVKNGRWSNPNTWDDGRTPTSDDNVEIRTVVYAGINATNFAGSIDLTGSRIDNKYPESTDYPVDGTNPTGAPAANTIKIANIGNGSLLIGNDDNNAAFVFKTKSQAANSFINENFDTTSPVDLTAIATKGAVNATDMYGLWITGFSSGATVIPAINTYQLVNKGAVTNQGIIEIGQ